MKNNLFIILTLFCFSILSYSCGCDLCCKRDCGEHGQCDEADGKCNCDAGYATLVSRESPCQDYSRKQFIGEWEAKDTMCSDSCHLLPYTVTFYPHPTDSTLFYAQNLASQICNNLDSAIWLASASDGYFRQFQHPTQTFPVLTLQTDWREYGLFIIHFHAVTGNDTLDWSSILRKK